LDLFLKILKKVMGLIDKITANKSNSISNTPTQDQLNTQELEFLLLLIKQSTFRGENIELVYNTALKLQSQHSKQTE
jgi:hypothetical protein